MEVHHHPHTARKKWTHYFWEFLMLFLAVTLGFLVENQREHYVEHLREKQYVKSLYDDFKVDTFTLQRTYDEKKWTLAKMDSVQQILKSGKITQNNELVYYFEKFLTKKDVFTSQDAEGTFGTVSDLSGVESKLFDAGDLNSLYDSLGATFYTLFKRPDRK